MNKKVVEKALSLVGQGYIYGAKGQICSPEFRKQQAQQYPEQADRILQTGEKWDGQPVWDCAQLTRSAAKAAGLTLVSGATSQWNKTAWTAKGVIANLPAQCTVFLYRQSDGKMQHTGVALGDGTCVHARGTAYGVVRQRMEEYAWTHWAALWPVEAVTEPSMTTAEVWAPSGSTVNLRSEPGGSILMRVPVGTKVQACKAGAGWSAVICEGQKGYMQSAFLRSSGVEEQLRALTERIGSLERRLENAGI